MNILLEHTDGREHSHQRHDTESDDENGENGAQQLPADGADGNIYMF